MCLRSLGRWILLGPLVLVWFAQSGGVSAQKAKAAPQRLGPVSFFAAHCERCHGPEGSSFGEGFGKGLSDSQLNEKVSAMATGPGGSPVSGNDLKALVALHRALILKQPFICWTAFTKGVISGETLSGTRVQLRVGKKVIKATVSGTRWSARLPPNSSPSVIVVVAKREKAAATLNLSRSAWSHTSHLPSRK